MTKLEIKNSPIEGKGLFTVISRIPGETIGIALLKVNNTGNPNVDYKQTTTGRFINHSEMPNIIITEVLDGNLGFQAIENIDAGEELLANYNQFSSLLQGLSKQAEQHNYVKKRKEESGNVTYSYSDKHVEKRNKAKAARIQKLSKSLTKVRAQVKKDLKSEDLNIRYTALAVALIDETFERIGNDESAREMKHYGVTTWCPKHISFSGSKATISYVGKSGVKQKKEVKNAELTRLLKELVKGKGKSEKIFVGEDYFITANKVNKYLHGFDITAKDIRGFHANDEMRSVLKTTRSKGPKLPPPGKERETLLKKEFKEALEEVAETVGHKPSTLKNQYLVPGMFTAYTEKGTIIKDFTKSALMLDKEEYGFIKQCAQEFRASLVCDDDWLIVEATPDFRKLLLMISRFYRKNDLNSPLFDSIRVQAQEITQNHETIGFYKQVGIEYLSKRAELYRGRFNFTPNKPSSQPGEVIDYKYKGPFTAPVDKSQEYEDKAYKMLAEKSKSKSVEPEQKTPEPVEPVKQFKERNLGWTLLTAFGRFLGWYENINEALGARQELIENFKTLHYDIYKSILIQTLDKHAQRSRPLELEHFLTENRPDYNNLRAIFAQDTIQTVRLDMPNILLGCEHHRPYNEIGCPDCDNMKVEKWYPGNNGKKEKLGEWINHFPNENWETAVKNIENEGSILCSKILACDRYTELFRVITASQDFPLSK